MSRPPLLLLFASLLLPAEARAISQCSFTGGGDLAFGAYDVFDTSPRDATASIVLRCQDVGQSDTVYVDLDGGVEGTRQMSGPNGAHLAYDIFLDAARTTTWGDGANGTSRFGPATPPDDTDWSLSAYGRIPARQNVPAGSYADTIVITVHF